MSMTSSITTMEAAGAPADTRRWWVLAVVVAAQFIYVVDAFIVNVAIPSIRADLAATSGEIQGVIVLYLIAFATLVVTGGRLGDIFGSKPTFLTGLVGFTLASLWCGLARSGTELVLARTFQGGAAALMIPQVLATVHRLFQGEERGRAFGIYGTALGLGATIGFSLGGWLVAFDPVGLGWRTVFFVNVPVGIALSTAAAWLMPAPPAKAGVRLDMAGAMTLFAALLCLLGPVVIGRDLGWPIWLLSVFALGAALLAAFWRIERAVERHGGLPLVHLDLLSERATSTALLAVLCFTFANLGVYFALTLYIQLGLGLSPLQSGLVIVPLAIAFAVASRKAAPRAQRRGPVALVEGCTVQVVGMALLAATVLGTDHVSPLALAAILIVFGVGQGMAMAPLYGLALSKIPPAHAGAGAGIMSTVQQVGNGTGVAVIGAIYFALAGHHSNAVAIVVSMTAAAIAVIGTASLLLSLRQR